MARAWLSILTFRMQRPSRTQVERSRCGRKLMLVPAAVNLRPGINLFQRMIAEGM